MGGANEVSHRILYSVETEISNSKGRQLQAEVKPINTGLVPKVAQS